MSLLLGTLRSHFLKHLCRTTTNATTTFFAVRQIHRLSPPHRFPFFFALANHTDTGQPRRQGIASVSADSLTPPYSSPPEVPSVQTFIAPYLSVRIFCRKDVADILSEALLCFGASSTYMEENESNENDEICISSTFSECQDVKKCISEAADSIGLKGIPTYEVEVHDHTDWIKASQESFHPVQITDGLWVVPEWRTPIDPQATNIVLHPGLAFGTGEHPTTKMCLLLLQELIKGGESFLDYGTGSGVLAIAALKFGAAFVVGFDIDSQAITSARYNATLNNIDPQNSVFTLVPSTKSPPSTDCDSGEYADEENADDVRILAAKEKYDVVVANILMNPLLELADHIVSYAKPGAAVALSGIISKQIPCIMERYSHLLDNINVSTMDDWACIHGWRRSNLGSS